MLTINKMITMFWKHTNPFWVWLQNLDITYQYIIYGIASIIAGYVMYGLSTKVYFAIKSKITKNRSQNLPIQNIETQKNQERESQIECTNNSDSKIVNNVYNM